MHREVIDIEWTAEERAVIVRCGYRFAYIRAALRVRAASHRIDTDHRKRAEGRLHIETTARRLVPFDQR